MDVSVAGTGESTCVGEVDEFVRAVPTARLCSLPSWGQAVSKSLGHRPVYLMARQGNVVNGVLPMVQVRSRLFGNRLVSQAFSNYGGPLADSREAQDALYERAVSIASELGCAYAEFRNVEPLPYDGLVTRTEKVTLLLPLAPDPDVVWRRFDPKIRNHIRKAKKSGIEAASGGAELLDDFYRVWTRRMHQLGTPCYPKSLFRAVFATFPDACRVFVVRLKRETVGAAFVYSFNGFVEFRWAATLVEYNSLCPNHLLYWSAMKHYCIAGATCFDFGHCTAGGPHHQFKKQWGPEEVRLHYQYWVRPGHELSIASATNPKFRSRIELWKRLPLWATRVVGPLIGKSLP